MKKIITFFAMLIMAVSLVSCNGKIENVTVKNLIGTWDLVSTEITYGDGTITKTIASGTDYLVISENQIIIGNGKTETTYPFRYDDPHFIIDGNIRYDVVSLTRKELVLADKWTIPILVSGQNLTYTRR
jgi:hypothetical protein